MQHIKNNRKIEISREIIIIIESKCVKSDCSIRKALLESELHYDYDYLRVIFSEVNNIGMESYALRRRYTYLILKDLETYKDLSMNATKYAIKRFKYKCIQQFGPNLENLQYRIEL